MLHIYNKSAITRKQRFQNAVVSGVIASVLCVIIFIIVLRVFTTYFPILYILFGYLIGYAIQRYGKGVQVQFATLAAGLTFATMLACDLMTFGSVAGILHFITIADMSAIMQILYRAFALFTAYQNSRIIS